MYCKLCILDAFQGRLSNGLANNSKKSWWIYTIFCIQTSEVLFKCVMGACVFHTVSIFFEPENACADSAIYTALQVLVILIYTFDIALKMSYEGIEVRFIKYDEINIELQCKRTYISCVLAMWLLLHNRSISATTGSSCISWWRSYVRSIWPSTTAACTRIRCGRWWACCVRARAAGSLRFLRR